ncbi:MAG TPA: hypothetical protein VK524_16860 [Polyangiaceae bacterium]|nr:hypothetical protein [Polyangiaceae bacterium]
MKVIHGYWECSRCGQKGVLPTSREGDWAALDENAAFVTQHIEECFTDEEFSRGIGSEDFFVGTLKIQRG